MSVRRKVTVASGLLLAGFSLVLWLVQRDREQGSKSAMASASWSQGTVYPDAAQAPADLRNALAQAAQENKHVLVDFGGNWCPDCLVLDIYLHSPPNLDLLRASYTLVHINIGRYDQNQDLAARYDIPLSKGVPALAVLDSSGKPLYVQRNGEFESMNAVDPAAVTGFLKRWKP